MEDRLRLLAHWHARRREVDELLEPLLAHGPAAVDRVSARLPELSAALEAEHLAFAAFAATVELHEAGQPERLGPVDELARARHRAERARTAMSAHLHPSVVDALHALDRSSGDLHLLDAPRPRPHRDGDPVATD